MHGQIKPAMLKNRLEKKSRKPPPAIPLLESQKENSTTPYHPKLL